MKPWCMHQFTAVFLNDFQMCSLISKSGVGGTGLQTSHLAADEVILPQHIADSEFNKLFPLLYRRFQNIFAYRAAAKIKPRQKYW